MYFGSKKKIISPILKYMTCVFVEKVGEYMEIYEINDKVVDKSKLLGYIGETATVELKDKLINIHYKGDQK